MWKELVICRVIAFQASATAKRRLQPTQVSLFRYLGTQDRPATVYSSGLHDSF